MLEDGAGGFKRQLGADRDLVLVEKVETGAAETRERVDEALPLGVDAVARRRRRRVEPSPQLDARRSGADRISPFGRLPQTHRLGEAELLVRRIGGNI